MPDITVNGHINEINPMVDEIVWRVQKASLDTTPTV